VRVVPGAPGKSTVFPWATFTFAGANNPYTDTAAVNHGFLLSRGVFTSFDFPGAIFTDAAGVNPGGIIVGVYVDSTNVVHGFIRTP
jgi:hypothetical protein